MRAAEGCSSLPASFTAKLLLLLITPDTHSTGYLAPHLFHNESGVLESLHLPNVGPCGPRPPVQTASWLPSRSFCAGLYGARTRYTQQLWSYIFFSSKWTPLSASSQHHAPSRTSKFSYAIIHRTFTSRVRFQKG